MYIEPQYNGNYYSEYLSIVNGNTCNCDKKGILIFSDNVISNGFSITEHFIINNTFWSQIVHFTEVQQCFM